MSSILAQIPLKYVHCCLQLLNNKILVLGYWLFKIICFETHQELKDIPSVDYIVDAVITPDERLFIITKTRGLVEFSLPGILYRKTHLLFSRIQCLKLLSCRETFLFNDKGKLMRFNLINSSFREFSEKHDNYISCIESSRNEELIFTTGDGKVLKKWDFFSQISLKSVKLEFKGCSLLVNEFLKSGFVGLENGSLSEFSIEDLSMIRSVSVQKSTISKIYRLRSGELITLSLDGFLHFPFNEKESIKVSENKLRSIIQLSDDRLVCSCDDGVVILSPPPKNIFFEKLDSISSNLKSILNSSSTKESQLASLLHYHLWKLPASTKYKRPKSTSLSYIFIPDIGSFQRFHKFKDISQGRKRIFDKKCLLDFVESKSKALKFRALLILFDNKLKLVGSFSNETNPLADFRFEEIKKDNRIFVMDQNSLLENLDFSGFAIAYFSNGYLHCHITKGEITTKSGYLSTLKVDGKIKSVIEIASDNTLVTSDGQIFVFTFENKKIVGFFQNF